MLRTSTTSEPIQLRAPPIAVRSLDAEGGEDGKNEGEGREQEGVREGGGVERVEGVERPLSSLVYREERKATRIAGPNPAPSMKVQDSPSAPTKATTYITSIREAMPKTSGFRPFVVASSRTPDVVHTAPASRAPGPPTG